VQHVLIAISAASVLLMMFYMGVYRERTKWNQLIEAGVLPKPKKR